MVPKSVSMCEYASRKRLTFCAVPTAALKDFSTAKGEILVSDFSEEFDLITKKRSYTLVNGSSSDSESSVLERLLALVDDDEFMLLREAMMKERCSAPTPPHPPRSPNNPLPLERRRREGQG